MILLHHLNRPACIEKLYFPAFYKAMLTLIDFQLYDKTKALISVTHEIYIYRSSKYTGNDGIREPNKKVFRRAKLQIVSDSCMANKKLRNIVYVFRSVRNYWAI